MAPMSRPLKLRDDDLPPPPRRTFHVDLPSPRTGEAPPALSPLDAFAMQSRMLARRFEEQGEDGRRISRLPHHDVAREFGARPGFFRGLSNDSAGNMSDVPELNEESRPTTSAGLVEKDAVRPISQYPVMGHAKKPSQGAGTSVGTPFFDAPEFPGLGPTSTPQDYFGLVVPRATSPEAFDSRYVSVEAPSPAQALPSLSNSIDTLPLSQTRKATDGSQHSQRSQRSDRGLVPPLSPRYPRSPRSFHSIRSVRQDSGDDDNISLNGLGSPNTRKFSGSNMSRPHSPFSPGLIPPDRSPSIKSDHSYSNPSHLLQQRPQFANFSRPMSSSGFSAARVSIDSRPSIELQPSAGLAPREPSISNLSLHSSAASSVPSRQNSEDESRDRVSVEDVEANGSQSYIYASYPLPRGRGVDRESLKRGSWTMPWEHNRTPHADQSDSRQVMATQSSAQPISTPDQHVPLQATNRFVSQQPLQRAASPAGSERLAEFRPSRAFADRDSSHRSHSAGPSARVPRHRPTPSVQTESTDQTIKAIPLHERNPSVELTPEEHLEVGIQAHDSGQFSKSTYHLRLAARAGLPTAMLLYALACRHGWGMRPNQEDGVMWLRKAIEGSQLELSDLEAALTRPQGKSDPSTELAERKKRKAQFALAIYELGISYMNGWGCQKDKALAVRCYEIAGTWGDCDALAEAGFCYAQGQGVKKDLKKAAMLYRKAADGGMSMAGQSWIYKPKYMDDDANAKTGDRNLRRPETSHGAKDKPPDKDGEKPTGRARSRSLWGRKKDKEKS